MLPNWKSALYDFLECDFSKWAEHNPKIWGNAYGGHMFNSSKAFGKNQGRVQFKGSIEKTVAMRKALKIKTTRAIYGGIPCCQNGS
jgi:hypothetical protein